MEKSASGSIPADNKAEQTNVEQTANTTKTPENHPVSTEQPNTESTPSKSDSPKSNAPPLGSRIQVLWRIIHDNEENESSEQPKQPQQPATTEQNEDAMEEVTHSNVEERWWGAVVQECTHEKVGSRCEKYADLNIHLLLYDAYNEFDEEIVKVAFLPDNVLLDLSMLNDSSGGRLDWEFENNNINSPSNICTAEHLVRETEQIAQQNGISMDADLQALSRMPHNVQLHVASGYRSFADSIKQLLGELVNSKPTGYVITRDDVQNIMARVRSQQRAGSQQPMAGAM